MKVEIIARAHGAGRGALSLRTGDLCRRCWTIALAAGVFLTVGEIRAQELPDADDEEKIERGRVLFTEETFGGNGRTCATCHPASNNFTVDKKFIKTLKGTDPIFLVGPSLPELKTIEVRRFIRNHALFLENVDGLKDENDVPIAGVMRSVPHTLGLGHTMDLGSSDDVERLGWSADGSPEDSLNSFADGAIKQHFPLTAGRQDCEPEEYAVDPTGCDFRKATSQEREDMEAFQLALGRQSQAPSLASYTFTDPAAETGKALFETAPDNQGGTLSCNFCHENGGSNSSGINENFNTGVALHPNAPGCLEGFVAPGDAGFGKADVGEATMDRRDLCGTGPNGGPNATVTFRGTGKFNAPPVIEAADTPEFFHNNIADTLEEAVAFYTSEAFGRPREGRRFDLTPEEIDLVAAFLRALNAWQNIKSAAWYTDRVANGAAVAGQWWLDLALYDLDDAVEVMTEGPFPLFGETDVFEWIETARANIEAGHASLDSDVLQTAIDALADAEDELVD